MTVVSVSGAFLDDAAKRANEHHQQAVEAASRIWFEHAVMVGEILLEVQTRVPPGEWLQFVKDRLTFQKRAANMYMRIAHYKDHISQDHPPTFTEAVHRLQFLPQRSRPSSVNAEVVESMRQMLGQGVSRRQVAKTFGVDHSTVTYWTDKTGFQKKRNQVRQAQHRLYRKSVAANRGDEYKAMTQHGGPLMATYRLVRRAQTEIDKIEVEGNDPQLVNIAKHLFQAERQLVEYLRKEEKTSG